MRIVVLFCILTIMVAFPAHANEADARKAFTEGVALYNQKEYTGAAAAFRESYHLFPSWKVFYNIAQCEAAATHYQLAIDAFEKYLADGGEEIESSRKKEVADELRRLRSRAAYQEGTVWFEKGEFLKAAAAFHQAYGLNPHWKVLYNIGQCEAAAKHYGRAMEAFEKYLTEGGDDILLERRREVESELDRLQRLVGYVEITAPSGAVIIIDDAERGTAPLPGRLMIAASVVHRLKIVHEGQEILNRDIQVNGRQSIPVDAAEGEAVESSGVAVTVDENGMVIGASNEPTVVEQPVTAPGTTAEKWRKRMIPMGISVMATGGAAIAASLIVGSVALKRRNDMEDACGNDGCPPDYHEKNTTVKHLARTGDVLFSAGATLAVAGGVLFFVGKRYQRKERAIAVNPVVGRDTAGLTVSGRF